MTSSVKAVVNPELRNILLNEGLMPGFRLLLGVEDTVYVTLLFSLFSYSQMWWNSIVTYTASSTPNKNQDFNNIRRHWIYDGETTHFFSTLDYVQIYKGSTFPWFLYLFFFSFGHSNKEQWLKKLILFGAWKVFTRVAAHLRV